MESPEPTIADLQRRAWERGYLEWKLWEQQMPIYNGIRSFRDPVEEIVVLCARQFGKCVINQSLIATPKGPLAVKDLTIGQEIYGYNSKGDVEVCHVVAKECMGIKPVVDLMNRDRVVATVTLGHRFLSRWKDNKESSDRQDVLTAEQILSTNRRKIARVLIDAPLGIVRCEHAYAIGAMIGNGCTANKVRRRRIHIASPDSRVPDRVAQIIGAPEVYRAHESNFTWVLSTKPKGKRGIPSDHIHFEHQEWFKHLYSKDKKLDRVVIETWDRVSCLELLAGLTDTDGSVGVQVDKTLRWGYSTSSKELAYDVQWLVYRLFGREPGLTEHVRRGVAEYTVFLTNNLHASRLLKQISPFMVMDHKKWLPIYEELNVRNSRDDRIGVTLGASYEAEVWDIQVDSDTNLFVLHNEGLITHNSHLGVVLATEDCLNYPGKCILIVGPTLDQTREIVVPRLELIKADAPHGLITRLKSEKKWMIGKSELVIGGFDVNSSSQRGKTVQNIYVEEIVDSNPDKYTESMRSDLGPALTHSDQGKMIFLSTLPKIPDHPFITETMAKARLNKAFFSYTIDDNKALTKAQYDACVRRAGGRDSIDFKREYLNEVIRDPAIVVIPHFDERHVQPIGQFSAAFYQTAIDWGGVRDKTVALLLAHDFYNDIDMVLDERVFPHNTPTNKIIEEVKRMESPYDITQRVIDAPHQLVQVDLIQAYNYIGMVPSKTDWQSAVNGMSVRFSTDKVRIDPKCKFLIESCRSGTFNDKRTDFSRTESLGHCDALAALMYGLRHMNRLNPYAGFQFSGGVVSSSGFHQAGKSVKRFGVHK